QAAQDQERYSLFVRSLRSLFVRAMRCSYKSNSERSERTNSGAHEQQRARITLFDFLFLFYAFLFTIIRSSFDLKATSDLDQWNLIKAYHAQFSARAAIAALNW